MFHMYYALDLIKLGSSSKVICTLHHYGKNPASVKSKIFSTIVMTSFTIIASPLLPPQMDKNKY